MSTKTEYVVKTPIHGYHGLGYDHLDYKETEFSTEEAAREEIANIQKLRKVGQWDGEMRQLQWHLTDCLSFHFTGDPVLIKRTVTEEVIA